MIVCEHSLPCDPQMKVEALSCQEEAIFNPQPETLPSSLTKSHNGPDRNV